MNPKLLRRLPSGLWLWLVTDYDGPIADRWRLFFDLNTWIRVDSGREGEFDFNGDFAIYKGRTYQKRGYLIIRSKRGTRRKNDDHRVQVSNPAARTIKPCHRTEGEMKENLPPLAILLPDEEFQRIKKHVLEEWVKGDDMVRWAMGLLGHIAALESKIARIEPIAIQCECSKHIAELRALDELCARRPAFDDCKTLCDKMSKAISVAGETDGLKIKLQARKKDIAALEAERDALQKRLNALVDLIRNSAPLAWATDGNEEAAYEWEKKAKAALSAEKGTPPQE